MCEGLGVKRMNVTEDLTLPRGLTDGQKIRITQLGHCSDCVSSFPGDLLLTIKVMEHATLRREGQNILSTVRVPMIGAILGTVVTIETLDGEQELEIKPGT